MIASYIYIRIYLFVIYKLLYKHTELNPKYT